MSQPPLGGCVLKHRLFHTEQDKSPQPPLGGCVLKQVVKRLLFFGCHQPPLGGCVLKRLRRLSDRRRFGPAAFRRLCVETLRTN